LNISAFDFNYGHVVVVNREGKAGVAGDRHQAEPIANVTQHFRTYPDKT
jgi:hypothetical protein